MSYSFPHYMLSSSLPALPVCVRDVYMKVHLPMHAPVNPEVNISCLSIALNFQDLPYSISINDLRVCGIQFIYFHLLLFVL